MSTFASQHRNPVRPSPSALDRKRKYKCDECQDTVYLVEIENDRGIFEIATECPECGEFRG